MSADVDFAPPPRVRFSIKNYLAMSRAEMLEALHERDELILQLRHSKLVPSDFVPRAFGLTRSEEKVLRVLMRASPRAVDNEDIVSMICPSGLDEPLPKIVQVYICKTRRKMREHGVEIGNSWGRGYYVDAENMARLRAMAEQEGAP